MSAVFLCDWPVFPIFCSVENLSTHACIRLNCEITVREMNVYDQMIIDWFNNLYEK